MPDTAEPEGGQGQLLALAAVLGPAFDVEDLAVLSDLPMAEVLAQVTAGIEAGVLDGSGSQLAFRSDEQRGRLLAGLDASSFPRLAGASPAGRSGPSDRPRREAALADGGRGVRWLTWTAARVAPSAPAVAVELLQAALPLADGAERSAVRSELALALMRTGRHDEGVALCRVAIREASGGRQGDLRQALVQALVQEGRLEEAEREAATALAAAGGGRRARFMAVRALTRAYQFRLAGADRLGRRAEAQALAEDDRQARTLALRARAVAAMFGCRLAEADRHCAAMLQAAAESQQAEAYGSALLVSALIATDMDRPIDAQQALQRGARIIEASGHAPDTPIVAAYAGAAHFWSGRWDDAAVELRRAAATPRAPGWFVDATTILAVLHAARGQAEEADRWVAAAEAAVAVGRSVSSPGRVDWMRGMVAEAAGDLGGARSHMARGWLAAEAAGVAREQRLIGPALVRLLAGAPAAPGSPSTLPAPAEVVRTLAAIAARNRHVPGLAGVVAWAEGMAGGDGERVATALELLRSSGRRHDAARAALDAALLLAGRPEWARSLAEQALGEFEHLGALGDHERAVVALDRAGLRVPPRRRPRRPPAPATLTPTEQRVAALVAEGLTNPEVAARLVVSPRTVSTHMSRILGKLGLRSRTELAVAIYRDRADPTGGPPARS